MSDGAQKHVKKSIMPKKPRTAYILWITENRAKIAEDGMKPTEVMKKAGGLWQEIDEKTKKVCFILCFSCFECSLSEIRDAREEGQGTLR